MIAHNSGQPLLAVIVVNYGSSALLESTIVTTVAALRQDDCDPIVVIVDSFSTAVERANIQTLCAREQYVPVVANSNLGFGGGMNLGASRAISLGAEVLLLLNPDAWIDPASVRQLVSHVRDHPLDLTAPLIRRPDGSTWSGEMDLYLETGQVRASRFRPEWLPESLVEAWVSGACVVISKELWNLVGGFDDDYFMYWEDIDLCHRVSSAGGKITVLEHAAAVHDESGTQDSKGMRRSALFYYYNTRNRLMFAAKHLTLSRRRGWRRAGYANARRLLRAEGIRLVTKPGAAVVPVLKGEQAGRRYLRQMS